jgi:CHASE1-domain containing sensor protein
MTKSTAETEAVELGEVVLHNNLELSVEGKSGEDSRSPHKRDFSRTPEGPSEFSLHPKELGFLLESQEEDAEHSPCWLNKCCFERWPVFIALCVLVAAMGVGYSIVHAGGVLDDEQLERLTEFRDVADTAVGQLQVRVDAMIGSLAGISSAVMALQAEDREHGLSIQVFKHLAWNHLFSMGDLASGVAFNSHVLQSERLAFEASHDLNQQASADFNYTIRQMGPNGLQYADNNSEYHAVTYFEPYDPQQPIGLDLWSLEDRTVINASRRTGLPQSTPFFDVFAVLGSAETTKAFVVFQPCFNNSLQYMEESGATFGDWDASTDTVEYRESHFLGSVSGVFHVGEMLKFFDKWADTVHALVIIEQELDDGSFHPALYISNGSCAPIDNNTLPWNENPVEGHHHTIDMLRVGADTPDPPDVEMALHAFSTVTIAQRQWRIHMWGHPSFRPTSNTWWITLLAFGLTSLIAPVSFAVFLVCWRRHKKHLASTHLLEGQAASLAGLADACVICSASDNEEIFWSNAVFQKMVNRTPNEVNGMDLHKFVGLVTEFDEDGAPLLPRNRGDGRRADSKSLTALLKQLERADDEHGLNSEDTLLVTVCRGDGCTIAEARISSVNARMGAKYYAVCMFMCVCLTHMQHCDHPTTHTHTHTYR